MRFEDDERPQRHRSIRRLAKLGGAERRNVIRGVLQDVRRGMHPRLAADRRGVRLDGLESELRRAGCRVQW